MKKIQIIAKNVQKAIEEGLKELNVTQDEVDIRIIDEGGLFKKAKVELILDDHDNEKIAQDEDVVLQKENITEEKLNPKEVGFTFLNELFAKMDVKAELNYYETETEATFNATGDQVSTLIGKRGETLNAIQDILSNVMKSNNFRDKRYFFDVENYKNRREISLIKLAERMAEKALKIEKPIKLERMNAYDRKIIHTALQNFEGVSTKSEGEEPNRRLIIIPGNDKKKNQ